MHSGELHSRGSRAYLAKGFEERYCISYKVLADIVV